MKVRSVIIGVLVGGAVVGGVGYAAYYTMRGQAVPVEVAPVANMASDSSWFSYEDSIWGSVTSQASQSVSLDSEYSIEEVYVTTGEKVTEGTPLFSYDMTLEEIELEGDEIELLSLQLQLSRSQKELARYQNMTPTAKSADTLDEEFDDELDELAFWRLPEFTLTALAAEDGISIESVEPVDAAEAADIPEAAEVPQAADTPQAADASQAAAAPEASGDGEPSVSVESVEQVDSYQDAAGAAESVAAQTGSSGGDLVIEEVEEVSNADAEDEVYRTAVRQYEDLMTTLELYANEDGRLEYTKTVRKALKKAVNFYQEKLTDNTEEETINENGETVTEVKYELKENVKRVLDEAELEELNAHVQQMETWQAAYEAQKAQSAAETNEEPESAAETAEEDGTEGKDAELTYLEGGSEPEDETPDEETPDEETPGEQQSGKTGTETETEPATTEATEEQTEKETETKEAESETEPATEPEPAVQTVADWISSFLLMAEDIEFSPSPELASYRNALEFYQQYLAAAPTIIIEDETEKSHRSTFQDLMAYQNLSDEVIEYLNPSVLGGETEPEEPDVTKEELMEIYERLCIDFCILLLDEEDEYFLEDLQQLFRAYSDLPEDQKGLVRHDSLLLGYALKYGLIDTLEEELESELESDLDEWMSEWDDEEETDDWYDDDWDYDYYDDWYDEDWDDGEEYTAEELQEIIAELEESIKELELDIRECELTVEQAQRVVDGKVVKSTMNGTVISVGDEEGNSDDDYFVRVASTAGLYAKGVISELELDTVNVGDEISGISDDGEAFTAVIKEVSDYPDSSGSDSVSGSGNSNASYYTFYALIDDPEGIEEGYADLTLSDAFANDSDSIWLETYFVRTDSAGNNYVYVKGSSGKLEQRFVSTGKVYEDWAVEITGGLGRSDLIAFPYGDNVYEGAPTKEVSSLEALYDD